jgi:predicted PurR-regulated permease PerM
MEPTRARMMQWLFWLTLVTLFVFFLQMVRPILLPFVVGMGVAYLFDPVADRLERLGLSRALAATFITLTFFIVLALILIWVGPLVYRQLSALLESLPNILASLRDLIEHQLAQLLHRLEVLNGGDAIPPEQLTAKAVTAASALLNRLMVSGAALLNLLSLLFITPIVCFYLLRDWDKIVEALDRLLPRAHAPVIREQFRIIDDTLAGYLRGQVTVMAILAIYYAGLLGIIGVNFSLVIALITALSIIIPYVGTLVSFSLALGVTYFGFGLEWQFWSVAGVYVLGQIMEQQFLTPTIVGKNVGLHPLWMLFGMLAGAVTMGFVGVLLAVPITAVIGVLARFFIGRYLASPLYGA